MLTVKLGVEQVIKDVSFCVHTGEFIGLIGPNGAGKTTLLKVLLGLLQPAEGKVTKMPDVIGYIPQRGYTLDNQVPMSVIEVVRLGSRGGAAQADQALSEVKMSEYTNKRFSELSGGQQQRVLIAKALAAQPSILILDEPTTGIDEQSQTEFFETLSRLQKKGITILMVSHDVDTVLKLVTRVICLNRSVIYDGAPEHFEPDKYLPNFYNHQHSKFHHKPGGTHA
jgi:zinc transport system ATP-binding protein